MSQEAVKTSMKIKAESQPLTPYRVLRSKNPNSPSTPSSAVKRKHSAVGEKEKPTAGSAVKRERKNAPAVEIKTSPATRSATSNSKSAEKAKTSVSKVARLPRRSVGGTTKPFFSTKLRRRI